MSNSFRPVQEIWGDHSSCFVDPDIVECIIGALAEDAGTIADRQDYGDFIVVWIQDGRRFLKFLRKQSAANLKQNFAPGFAHEHDADLADVESLLLNMHGLAGVWAKSLGDDGSIRFYIGG